MYRRMAQKWVAFAFDETDGTPVTGATITGKISQDGAAATALATTAPAELETGYYAFSLTEAETDADEITLIAVASLPANTQVVGAPATQNTFNHVISGECTSTGDAATVNTTLHTAAPGGHGLTTANALNGRVLIFDTDTATTALRQQAGNITGYTSGGVITFAASTFTVGHAATDTFKIY